MAARASARSRKDRYEALCAKLRREQHCVRVVTSRGTLLQADEPIRTQTPTGDDGMAKGQQRGNREIKKPKKDKAKAIAAAPSRKDVVWQPDFGPTKKK